MAHQGDLEQLLRDAAKVKPLPLVTDDPRLGAFGAQFATMLLMREAALRELRKDADESGRMIWVVRRIDEVLAECNSEGKP